jgi:hypothetical protein
MRSRRAPYRTALAMRRYARSRGSRFAQEERAGPECHETAERGSSHGEDRKFAAEMSAEMVDREKAEGQDAAFERCRNDGADGARDDADDNVGSAHKHPDSFGEW